jgi:hypothetical protein
MPRALMFRVLIFLMFLRGIGTVQHAQLRMHKDDKSVSTWQQERFEHHESN